MSVVCPLCPHIIRRDDPQDLAHHVARRGIQPSELLHILINIDEVGLAWRQLPQRTYVKRGTKFEPKKGLKDRVTVMLGCSIGILPLGVLQ